MSRHLLITIITVVVILISAGIAILLTKGYTFSPGQGRVVGTGIISVSSTPSGASIFLDGHLTSATDTTISSLSPREYAIRIIREGFIPWEKTISVKEGLVTEVKATLFPSIPTIYPLTYNGVGAVVISPDGTHLAFGVPKTADGGTRQKGGVWVWTMESGPIAFARGAQPHQLVASTTELDFAQASLRFSPDSSQVLVSFKPAQGLERNYLLPVGNLTNLSDLRDITPTLQATLKNWEEDQKVKEAARIAALKDLSTAKIASSSASVQWSPDETKFLVTDQELTANSSRPLAESRQLKARLIDLGTTEKLLDTPQEYSLPEALSYTWLPDSKHLVLVQTEALNIPDRPNNPYKIAICEFDAQNCAVIYSGVFEANSVFAWPDASRLMLVTSFNTPTASSPNLFGINLK